MSNYRAVSLEQDCRYSNRQSKQGTTVSYPSIYSTYVDIRKVNLDVIRTYIHDKVVHLLGFEDDVLINFIMNQLEDAKSMPTGRGAIDGKALQSSVEGFLPGQSTEFIGELYTNLVSACSNPHGIPQSILDAKQSALRAQKVASTTLSEERLASIVDMKTGLIIGGSSPVERVLAQLEWQRRYNPSQTQTQTQTQTQRDTPAPAAAANTSTTTDSRAQSDARDLRGDRGDRDRARDSEDRHRKRERERHGRDYHRSGYNERDRRSRDRRSRDREPYRPRERDDREPYRPRGRDEYDYVRESRFRDDHDRTRHRYDDKDRL